MNTLKEIIARCETLAFDLNFTRAKEWKSQDTSRVLVGQMPVYFPREIVHAVNGLTVGILGGGNKKLIIKGDAYYQSYICHIPRSIIELALDKHFEGFDGFIFPSICDVIRNLSGMFQLMGEGKFVKYLDLPQNFKPHIGGEFYLQELRNILNKIYQVNHVEVTPERLNNSIRLFNKNRSLINRIYDIRQEFPWRMTAADLYHIVRAGYVIPVEEHNEILEQVAGLIQQDCGDPMDKIRVLVIGAFCEQPPAGLIRTIELAGCYIVEDDFLLGARWDGFKMGNKTLEDGWSDSIDPLIGQGMGETAENLFDKYCISREEQDDYAVSSHQKASVAQKNGWFNEEIVPVEVPVIGDTGSVMFRDDETIRHEISREKISTIKPAFRKNGTVTAGNSCGLSDGAAAMVVTHRKKAEELGVKPLFSIIAYAQLAVEPAIMGEGPALSIPSALKKAGMTLSDMDIIEVNEAFAIQVLANERTLKWDRAKLNVHGGAIALGHPTGTSGARILVTGYYALKRLDKTHCIAAICGGGGVTTAMVIKRES